MSTGGTPYKPRYSQSWALVVGIDAYQSLPPLKHAVADARLIARTLEALCDFPRDHITALEDGKATRDGIHDAFEALAGREEVRPDDRVDVFFAGHGVTRRLGRGDGEVGYLAPVNAGRGNWNSFIEMTSLVDRAKKFIPAKHILFLLDACFSGLVFTRDILAQDTEDIDQLERDLLTRDAIQAVSADMADQPVADGFGRNGMNSIFTASLVEGIEGAAMGKYDLITARDLFDYVQTDVARRSKQTPDGGNIEGRGNMVLRRIIRAGEIPFHRPRYAFFQSSTERTVMYE